MSSNNNNSQNNIFNLTPLESIYINKLMPIGFKLESEEIFNGNSNLNSNNNFNNNNNTNNNTNNKKNFDSLQMKFINFYEKLLKFDYSEIFYCREKFKEPSLIDIENKIKEFKYKCIFDLVCDLRKMWKFYLEKYKENKEIFNNALKMSKNTENIFKLDFDENVDDFKKEEIEIFDIYNQAKKFESDLILNKEEKLRIGANIKKLNLNQCKGIIGILINSGNFNDKKDKYLEFDIDKIPTKTIRQIDFYLKKILKEKYINNKNENNDDFKNKNNNFKNNNGSNNNLHNK